MGFPVTLSMTAGMFVGWGILSPLSKHLGWAPGPVSSSTDGARGWIVCLTIRLGLMAAMGSASNNDCRIHNLLGTHHLLFNLDRNASSPTKFRRS